MEEWIDSPSPITDGQYLTLDGADFNLDNHEDWLVCGPNGVRTFMGTGNLPYIELEAPLVDHFCSDASFCLLDFTDAYLDIIACSADNEGIWVFYYDETDSSWTAGNRPDTTGSYNRLRGADFNKDSYLDIVATSAEYHGIHIWYGTATGDWIPATPLEDGSAFFALDVGDIVQ